MISLCVPSRGRPHRAKLMIETALDTAKHPDHIEILLYLNDDDITIKKYTKRIDQKYIATIGPHQSTCFSWNQMAYQAKHNIVALVGDDVQFKSKDWDTEIVSEYKNLPDPMYMIVPHTGRPRGYSDKQIAAQQRYVPQPNEKLNCPHFTVTKDWIKYFGYICPPMFWHFYVDTYTQTVASGAGRCIYKPNIVWRTKKIEDGTTLRVRNDLNIRNRDNWVWEKCKRYLDADIEYLKSYKKEN